MIVKRTYYFPGDRTQSVTFNNASHPDITDGVHYYTDVLGIDMAINNRWLYYKDEVIDELCTEGSIVSDQW